MRGGKNEGSVARGVSDRPEIGHLLQSPEPTGRGKVSRANRKQRHLAQNDLHGLLQLLQRNVIVTWTMMRGGLDGLQGLSVQPTSALRHTRATDADRARLHASPDVHDTTIERLRTKATGGGRVRLHASADRAMQTTGVSQVMTTVGLAKQSRNARVVETHEPGTIHKLRMISSMPFLSRHPSLALPSTRLLQTSQWKMQAHRKLAMTLGTPVRRGTVH